MGDRSVVDNAVPRRAFLKLGATGGAILALGAAGSALVPDLRRRGLLSLDGVVRRRVDGVRRQDLRRGLPDEPADPLAVQGPPADPQGSRPRSRCRSSRPGRARRGRGSVSRPTPTATSATRCGRATSGPRTRSSTRSRCRSTPTRSPSSQVLPIDSLGQPTKSFDATGKTYPAGTERTLPASTIYGFNGTFPGPMINAEYGRPALVRFENHLDENPLGLDRQDFGSPDCSFLTHLHNGAHRAGERRQPALLDDRRAAERGLQARAVGRQPLPELAGRRGRPGEAELLLVPRPPMDHTGANVYKGMVGLYPIYDPRTARTRATSARACGCPGSARTTPTARSTSTTTSRWRSSTAVSTTA